MDSPRSTTSSSDLYSNSDSANYRAQPHPAQNGLAPRQVSQSLPEDPMSESIGSRRSNTSQTIRGYRGRSLSRSRGGSTSLAAVSDGNLPDTSHKRKRDHDPYPVGYASSYQISPDVDHTIAGSSSADTSTSVKCTISAKDDWLRNKRSKTDEYSVGSTGTLPNSSPSSVLPAELWQYIFCFVPPVSLGRLLRVSSAFNAFLILEKTDESHPGLYHRSVVKPMTAHSVWAASRKRFCPGLPKPLRGLQELDMWRLLRGRNCQMCGEIMAPSLEIPSESPWESGPGEKGVRVIWPFGIRCCGRCLQKNTEKEIDLLLSSSFPSFLLPALPFALISSSNHCIANSVLRSTATPPNLQLTKHYYKPHIEEIKRQLDDVKELGPASAEEWIKGLDGEGKERINDAIRWEQWEARGGLKKVNQRPHIKALAAIGPVNAVPSAVNSKGDVQSERSTPQSVPFSVRYNGESGSPAPSLSADSPYSTQNFTSSFQSPWTAAAAFPDSVGQRSQALFQQPRPERNIRDVNEAKAARRAEIERRCATLQPPLLAGVLGHMESFQAAIQISQPLTDQAWEVLKPRLLAQRPYAEKREQDRIQQSQMIQAEYKQRRQQEAQLKETKETFDREWDSVQTPVRNRISALADERIGHTWASGNKITKDTCPMFAADVLLYARQRFYEDMDREDTTAVAAGEPVKLDPPNGPPTRKLILENMKWLFDTKIKPLTEHFQKELFLCNGCDGNFKFYGFEGVIQHYAAKHTTTLSMGSVVVHWRAEWPEHPPFNPNPSVAKAAYYKVPTPAIASPQGPSTGEQPLPVPYGSYGQNIDSQAAPHTFGALQQPPETYNSTYGGHQQDITHALPPAHPGAPHLDTSHLQAVPQTSNFTASFSGSQNAHGGFQSTLYGQNTQAYSSPFLGQAHPITNPNIPQVPEQNLTRVPGPDFGANAYGKTSTISRPSGLPSYNIPFHSFEPGRTFAPQATDLYKVQMDTMARHARDVWFATAGIKDIPQSVRIYVVIQHTASRFAARFTNEPSLAMFIDGIDHSSVMRPVRSLNGLACKTCVHTGAGTGERRLFTLPHLLNHFKNTHVENPHTPMNVPSSRGIPRLDWKTEMIELPETPLIADLINAPGIDDSKLDLISWALPGAFPSPLPRMGATSSLGPVPIYRGDYNRDSIASKTIPNALPESLVGPLLGARDRVDDQVYNGPLSEFRLLSQNEQPSEPPGEDEYDPHRPAFLGKIVKSELGPSQSRKHTVSSPARNGRQSVLNGRRDESPYTMARYEESHRPAYRDAPSQSVFKNDRTDLRYEQPGNPRRLTSPKGVHILGSGGHYEEQDVARSIREAYENMRNYDGAAESNKRLVRVSETSQAFENKLPVTLERRTQSPNEGAVKAADQFLNSLGRGVTTGLGSETVPSRNGSAAQSASRWVDDSQGRREERHANQGVDSYGWEPENTNREIKSNELSSNQIRAGSLAPRGEKPNPFQRPTSDVQYAREYRSTSHIQTPLNGSRLDARSPAIYAPYQPPQPAVIYRPDVADHPVQKPRSRGDSVQMSQASRYRTRSRSPRVASADTSYHRARTPIEEPRHEAVYRIRSPLASKDTRYHKAPSYDYAPLERYEYIDDRSGYEDPYRQRIEYVPMRVGEHSSLERGRYVMAQPLDSRPHPEYVRIERGYGEEPIYERNGQLYHEGPRAYQVQGYGNAPQPIHGYRY